MKNRSLEDALRDKFSSHNIPANPSSWKVIQSRLTHSLYPSRIYYLAAASLVGIVLIAGAVYDRYSRPVFNPVAQTRHKKEIVRNKIAQDVENKIKQLKTVSKNIPDTKSQKIKSVLAVSVTVYSSLTERKEQLLLADSSFVSLNEQSSIKFKNMPGQGRVVDLTGEAYFKVKNQKDVPFIINSGNALIEVIGTAFNVRNYNPDSIVVLVEEGKVKFGKIGKPGKFIYLTAGEKGILGTEGVHKVSDFEANELAWKTGSITFEKTKMSKAVAVVEDYFKIKIRVSDPSLLNCHITARFKRPGLNKVLDMFSALMQIKYEKKNDVYILTGKGCD